MRFKQFSGTAIVPFLARVVLALAFVTVGYNKIFTQWTVTDQATLQSLRAAGVNLSPPPVAPPEADADGEIDPAGDAEGTSFLGPRAGSVLLAGFVQPAGGESALPPDAATAPNASTLPAPLPESADVRSLHRITLMLHRAANPGEDGASARMPAFVGDYAKWLAWIAALTEFLGGVMILFGMLTRIWGIGLAIAMVTAYWLTTVPEFTAIASTGVVSQALAFAASIPDYNRAVAQLALFVLAFGLALTGAGPLSVDAILFARDPHRDVARDGDSYDGTMHPGVPPGGAAMTPGSVAAPMGAAAGTAYPPGQPAYPPGQPAYPQGPPGVQMPPSGGYQPPPPTDAWGTPTAPVPPPAAPVSAPPPEIPLHDQPSDPAPSVPPVAPRPQTADGLPSVPAPEDQPRAADADAGDGDGDGSGTDEDRPRYHPGQSFGGEGRPL